MKKALQEKQWDIVLCDYKLPKFNAISAIAVLKETNIDIPLLIVSGAIGEETAVECMRLGAHDYIMKNNLSRLCQAIARELEEADSRSKRKQAEEALRQSEERFRILFEQAADSILLLEILPEGIPVIRDANSATFRLLGYERDEIIGQPVSFMEVAPDASKVVDKRRRDILSEMGAVFQARHRCKDGTIRDFECSATEMQIGSKTFALSVERDITKRKRAESQREAALEALKESENKYRLLADNVNDVIFVLDMNLNYTYVSPSAKILRGYEPAEVLKQTPSETLTPSSWDLAMRTLSEGLELEKSGHRELPISWMLNLEMRRKDGTTVWTEVKFSIIRDENQQPVGILGVTRDITDRKRIGDDLKDSEKKYRELYDFLPIPVYEMDLEANIISANRAIYEAFRGTEEDLKKGFKGWQLLSPEEVDKSAKNIQRLLKGEQVLGTEYTLMRLDGSVFPAIVISSVIYSDGKPVGLRGAIIDITERKQAEESLRKSEEKYRTILENIEDGYYEVNLNGDFTFFNASMCRILGYPQEEMMGMNNRQFTDKENAKKLFKTFNEVYRTAEPAKEFDWQIIRKDGTERYIEVSVSLQKNSSGKPIGFRGVARDITARKQAEEALRKSEEMLRLITENMSDMIRVTNLQGVNLYLSPSHFKHLGYSMEERVGKSNFDIVHPDDVERLIKLFSERLASIQEGLPPNQRIAAEYRVRHADGHYIWLETVGDILRDAQGKPMAIVESSRDITERKQAEGALQDSEEKYRLVVENAKEAIIITQDVKLVFANRAAVDMTGYSEEILKSKTFTDFIHPDDRNMVVEHHIKRLAGEEIPSVYSFRIISQDGTVIWAEHNAVVITWKGRPATLNFLNDITERKQAEEELRKSEHLHRIITNNIRDTVSLLDINFRATWINPSVTKTVGFTLDELAQVPLERQLTPDSMQRIQDLMLEHLTAENLADKNKELNVTGEFEFYRKNGDIFWDEMNISLLRDADGKPTGFLTVGRDITERKRAEEERKQSFERMRKALRATVQAISLTVEMKDPYTSGHQQRVSDLARAIATEMGLSADRRTLSVLPPLFMISAR